MSINSGPPSVLTSPPCWGRVLEDYQGREAGGEGEVEELTRPWQAPSNWGGLSLYSHPTGTDQPTSLHGQLGPARLCSPSWGGEIRSGPQAWMRREEVPWTRRSPPIWLWISAECISVDGAEGTAVPVPWWLITIVHWLLLTVTVAHATSHLFQNERLSQWSCKSF